MITLTELLLARGLADGDRHLVELIRLAGHHVLTMAEDLVDEASLDADRLRIEEHAFDPADTARAVVALWTPGSVGGSRHLDLLVDPATPSVVTADEARVRQILFNLVANAVKFTPDGHVTVSVGPSEDGGVRFEVRDDGAGLPDGFAIRPFTGGNAEAPGAGLGLWISSRIAEALSARLTLLPGEERGTVATLDLPLRRVPRKRRTAAGRGDRKASPRKAKRAARTAAAPATAEAAPVPKMPSSLETRGDPPVAPDAAPNRTEPVGEAWIIVDPDDLAIDAVDAGGDHDGPYPEPVVALTEQDGDPLDGDPTKPVVGGGGIDPHTDAADAPQGESDEPVARSPATPLAGLTALVVDDSAISRMLMTAVLSSFDMVVETATGGDEAVAAVAISRPDVILLDWSLPGETGAEVLARLDDVLGPDQPPVLAVTAAERLDLRTPVAGHVVKPFSPRELYRAMERALAGAPAVETTG